MRKKMVMATSMVILLTSISILSVSAQEVLPQNTTIHETVVLNNFMDEVEQIASESQTYSDFVETLIDCCQTSEFKNDTIIQELISKILQFLTKDRGVFIGGININDFLAKFSSKFGSDYFVISYGVYNRLNPLKDNSIYIFKIGLSMWRFSSISGYLKCKTLILEQHPFSIHQKIIGSQLGFMTGFKGIYFDIESKITKNSYMMFIGYVDRIRVFELPFDSQ